MQPQSLAFGKDPRPFFVFFALIANVLLLVQIKNFDSITILNWVGVVSCVLLLPSLVLASRGIFCPNSSRELITAYPTEKSIVVPSKSKRWSITRVIAAAYGIIFACFWSVVSLLSIFPGGELVLLFPLCIVALITAVFAMRWFSLEVHSAEHRIEFYGILYQNDDVSTQQQSQQQEQQFGSNDQYQTSIHQRGINGGGQYDVAANDTAV